LFNAFSVTKGVAAVCLNMLFDRHLATPLDKVADHWPAFAQNVGGL
jgi:CubicO group peptidase (beta-lactamase class C family)